MFLETFTNQGKDRGWIEAICGSMFSGKTEELIRRVKRAQIANQKVQIFKPKVDNRYDDTAVVSHDQNRKESIVVEDPREILKYQDEVRVIAIDEVQFFDESITEVVRTLADNGKRVIVAGLDMNFKGEPFGEMPNLLAMAEFITKLHAICDVCGNIAGFSYRKSGGNEEVVLGAKENYEPRCRVCYQLDSTS